MLVSKIRFLVEIDLRLVQLGTRRQCQIAPSLGILFPRQSLVKLPFELLFPFQKYCSRATFIGFIIAASDQTKDSTGQEVFLLRIFSQNCVPWKGSVCEIQATFFVDFCFDVC
jgi:hypothetical protein